MTKPLYVILAEQRRAIGRFVVGKDQTLIIMEPPTKECVEFFETRDQARAAISDAVLSGRNWPQPRIAKWCKSTLDWLWWSRIKMEEWP